MLVAGTPLFDYHCCPLVAAMARSCSQSQVFCPGASWGDACPLPCPFLQHSHSEVLALSIVDHSLSPGLCSPQEKGGGRVGGGSCHVEARLTTPPSYLSSQLWAPGNVLGLGWPGAGSCRLEGAEQVVRAFLHHGIWCPRAKSSHTFPCRG